MPVHYVTTPREILAIKDGVYIAAFSTNLNGPTMFAFTTDPKKALTIEHGSNSARDIITILKNQGIL